MHTYGLNFLFSVPSRRVPPSYGCELLPSQAHGPDFSQLRLWLHTDFEGLPRVIVCPSSQPFVKPNGRKLFDMNQLSMGRGTELYPE